MFFPHLSKPVTKHWVHEWAVELWKIVSLSVKNIEIKLNCITVILWNVFTKSVDIKTHQYSKDQILNLYAYNMYVA